MSHLLFIHGPLSGGTNVPAGLVFVKCHLVLFFLGVILTSAALQCPQPPSNQQTLRS